MAISTLRETPVYCIDRLGREVYFTAPEEVEHNLDDLLGVFDREFRAAVSPNMLSRTFAKFYYGFIAIHPFQDANRRTALEFLKNRAAEKEYGLDSPELLKKVLLEGNVRDDMQKLWVIFDYILKPLKLERS